MTVLYNITYRSEELKLVPSSFTRVPLHQDYHGEKIIERIEEASSVTYSLLVSDEEDKKLTVKLAALLDEVIEKRDRSDV